MRPDPVLALLVAPDGSEGWAVGGETGTSVEVPRRSDPDGRGDALRRQCGAARERRRRADRGRSGHGDLRARRRRPVRRAPAPTSPGPGSAPTAGCARRSARPRQMPGLRAFLYTGAGRRRGRRRSAARRGPRPARLRPRGGRLRRRLGAAAGSLPVFAAAAESDLDGADSLATFAAAFSGLRRAARHRRPGPGDHAGLAGRRRATPTTRSTRPGKRGTVRVIVLDYSAPSLGDEQRCWLAGQLAAAGAGGDAGDRRRRARPRRADVDQRRHRRRRRWCRSWSAPARRPAAPRRPPAASAYFFDFPEENRAYRLSCGRSLDPRLRQRHARLRDAADGDGRPTSSATPASCSSRSTRKTATKRPTSPRSASGSMPVDRRPGARRRPTAPCCAAASRRSSKRWPAVRWPGTRCEGSSAPRPCELLSPDALRPDPVQLPGGELRDEPLPRIHLHLLGARHRRLRRPRPGLAQPAQRPAGQGKAGARLRTRACSAPSTPARPRSRSRPAASPTRSR